MKNPAAQHYESDGFEPINLPARLPAQAGAYICMGLYGLADYCASSSVTTSSRRSGVMSTPRKFKHGDVVEIDDQTYWVGYLNPKTNKRFLVRVEFDGRFVTRTCRGGKKVTEEQLAKAKLIKAYQL